MAVGLEAGLRHASYTPTAGSTEIMFVISMSYQSTLRVIPSKSSRPEFGVQTKPAVRVSASSGLTCGLPVAFTNGVAKLPFGCTVPGA